MRNNTVQTHAPRRGFAARRAAFTLIEMLVVIVIIAILAGMVFALAALVGRHADRARTIRRVEMLANAIEEFRAEYGKYPPVPVYNEGGGEDSYIQPIYYEWPVRRWPPTGEPVWVDGLRDSEAQAMIALQELSGYAALRRGVGRLFTFGLASFLMTRHSGGDDVYNQAAKDAGYRPGHAAASYAPLLDSALGPGGNPRGTVQWFDHNTTGGDLARDQRAIERFSYYVNAAHPHTDWIRRPTPETLGRPEDHYYNRHVTFRDAWGQNLRYESHPPYDSYRLWSVGPDGRSGTEDDVVAGKEGK